MEALSMNKRKLAAFILALSLLLSLGACAEKPAQTPGPEPTPSETPAATPEPGEKPAPDKSNLKGFYEWLVASELLPEGTELTEQILDDFYGGLSEIELRQRIIFIPTFNLSATEIALFELKDSKDADRVLEIITNRLTDLDNLWKEYLPQQYELVKNARIVQNNNFILFVIAEHAEEIEASFNELFQINSGAADL